MAVASPFTRDSSRCCSWPLPCEGLSGGFGHPSRTKANLRNPLPCLGFQRSSMRIGLRRFSPVRGPRADQTRENEGPHSLRVTRTGRPARTEDLTGRLVLRRALPVSPTLPEPRRQDQGGHRQEAQQGQAHRPGPRFQVDPRRDSNRSNDTGATGAPQDCAGGRVSVLGRSAGDAGVAQGVTLIQWLWIRPCRFGQAPGPTLKFFHKEGRYQFL